MFRIISKGEPRQGNIRDGAVWLAFCQLAVAGAGGGGAGAAAIAGCAVAGIAGAATSLTAFATFWGCRRCWLNLTFDDVLHIVIVLFVFVFAPPSFPRRLSAFQLS